MTKYEELLEIASQENVKVYEKYDLSGTRLKGLYCDGVIALDKDIETQTERACVLAEELGHHYTTVGDITDLTSMNNQKQELKARLTAYNDRIGLRGIIDAYKARRTSPEEMAEFLDVTPEFLQDALECYRTKYAPYVAIDNYVVFFEPCLAVLETLGNCPLIETKEKREYYGNI